LVATLQIQDASSSGNDAQSEPGVLTLHEPLQCVDYDGPAKALPVPVKKLGSRPGSLGSYAGITLGIPTITFELPRNAASQSPKFLWRFYGEALIQTVLYSCVADG
jgi:murein peptide amidase A